MSASKPALGIIASDYCRRATDEPKRWWHLRRFAEEYATVLEQYTLVATSNTAAILRGVKMPVPKGRTAPVELDIHDVGPTFRGVVCLAAEVARRNISRVLWFQDPNDLDISRPENLALLRNCNLAGAHLLINAAAHLWALHRGPLDRDRPVRRYLTEPLDLGDGRPQETVILIAHDAEKPRMCRFALHYRQVLRLFPRRLGTSGTVQEIAEYLKERVHPNDRIELSAVGATKKMAHGPSGGDVLVADELFRWYEDGGIAAGGQHVLHHIFFFTDNRRTHPHEADIRVLLTACVNPLHRVNLILNSRMAEEWAGRYMEAGSAM